MLVRCRDRELTYRPIAGTRVRGANAERMPASLRNCLPTKRSAPST